MPYIDLRENKEGVAMIETVCKRIAGATKREIEKAYIACTVQHRIGYPPNERFKESVSLGENGLRNFPITVSDVSNAPVVFGPNCPRIRGETMRDTKVVRLKEQCVNIPRDVKKIHNMITITAENPQDGDNYSRYHVCEWDLVSGHFLKKN
jgi:hypothetical protein